LLSFILRTEKICIVVAMLLVCPMWSASSAWADKPNLYTTSDVLEVDTCATVWLIKKFVNPLAVFAFYQEGTFSPEGTAFDTPYAEWQRGHNASTFEVIMAKKKITDKRLKELAAIIHDIEINYWGKKRLPVTRKIEQEVVKILETSEDNQQKVLGCLDYFDALFNTLKQEAQEEVRR